MSVMKNSATQHLINQIKSALAVGKIATVDAELNENSTNPVQNKAIAEAIADISEYKAGDVIEISGTFVASVSNNIAYDNGISLSVTIPLPKIKGANLTIDEDASSGFISFSTSKGYVKLDGNDMNQISMFPTDYVTPSVETSMLRYVYGDSDASTFKEQDGTDIADQGCIFAEIQDARFVLKQV